MRQAVRKLRSAVMMLCFIVLWCGCGHAAVAHSDAGTSAHHRTADMDSHCHGEHGQMAADADSAAPASMHDACKNCDAGALDGVSTVVKVEPVAAVVAVPPVLGQTNALPRYTIVFLQYRRPISPSPVTFKDKLLT